MKNSRTFVKFVLSSLSSFIVDYILFGIFLWVFPKVGVPEYVLVSNVLARLISAAYNYFVNAKVVFRMKKTSAKSAVQYFLLALFILVMNNIILCGVLFITKLPPMVSKVITELILFCMSFMVQHIIIFKKEKSSIEED